jgi:hypothetical protein
MKPQTILVPAVIAILLGILQTYLLTICWGYIAANTLVPQWLVGIGLRGTTFRAVMFLIDFLTSVLLSLPAAFILIKLLPNKLWLYLVLAIAPSFAWLNYGLVGNVAFAELPAFVLGWLPELFALPASAWLLQFAFKVGTPNNSFKPKPLRRSA